MTPQDPPAAADRAPLVLDARGLACPLPVLRARKMLNRMEPGALLEVLATDPGSIKDFAAFCRHTGDVLVESGQEDEVLRYLIRRRDDGAAGAVKKG